MYKDSVAVLPSVMAADIGHLADEVQRVEKAGADGIHIDVMDAHFVPNLAFSSQSVAAINRATSLFLEVHLMMYNPFDYIEAFVKAGADRIIIHFEATEAVEDTLAYIRKCGVQAGLAFSPETSASLIPKFLPLCDLILLMTVHPGFGGQKFLDDVIPKIEFVREVCDKLSIREGGKTFDPQKNKGEMPPPFLIEVDGGIDADTAKRCVAAGANVLTAGSYIFQQKDLGLAIASLKKSSH